MAKALLHIKVRQHAFHAAVFEIEIVGKNRVADSLMVSFEQPSLALREVTQQGVEAAAELIKLVRDFVEAIIGHDQFQ